MSLDAKLLDAIAGKGVVRRYPKKTILIHEGDTSDMLFIVLEGSVRVYTQTEDGKPFDLRILGPGEYFGELALDGGPRAASVMTLVPTACALVTRRTLREFIHDHPDFGIDLIFKLIRRVREMTDDVKGLAHRGVYHRLVALLQKEAVPDETGQLLFPIMTQQEMANRIGSDRSMVSKLLKDLRLGGYIAVVKTRIVLVKTLPLNW
jgi:CRP/FNR family cyclic AMP-dependent transcriptional regulator